MNKRYYGGRKEKFKFKESDKFIDFNSIYKEEINKTKNININQVISYNSVFFGVLVLLSFLLYCIKHLVEG